MKILVVEDQPPILDALAQLLTCLGTPVILRTAARASDATDILDDEPDVATILLDLALADTRPLDFLADLRLDYPAVPVVVLASTHDEITVNAARAAGARGVIPRLAPRERMLEALRQSLFGSAAHMGELLPPGHDLHVEPRTLGLTPRQADVLKLLAEGKPNKLICRDLRLSEGTVKVHVSAILKALRVQSRTQAVAELARRGISTRALGSRH